MDVDEESAPASSQVFEKAPSQDEGMDPDTSSNSITDADTGTWALSHVETEADTGRWSLLQPDNPEYKLVAYAYVRGNKKTKWCYNPPGVAFHPGWLCPRLGFQPEENKRK